MRCNVNVSENRNGNWVETPRHLTPNTFGEPASRRPADSLIPRGPFVSANQQTPRVCVRRHQSCTRICRKHIHVVIICFTIVSCVTPILFPTGGDARVSDGPSARDERVSAIWSPGFRRFQRHYFTTIVYDFDVLFYYFQSVWYTCSPGHTDASCALTVFFWRSFKTRAKQ